MNAVSGGAYPSFAESFNVNPAAIPTSPTPLGVEYVYSPSASSVDGSNRNFAFIRGFNRMGAAFSTNSDNTFYSNSYSQGLLSGNLASAESIIPTLNFGFSKALLAGLSSSFQPTLGAALRYSSSKNVVGYSLGASINSKRLSLGINFLQVPNSGLWPKEVQLGWSASLDYDWWVADLTYMKSTILRSYSSLMAGTLGLRARSQVLSAATKVIPETFVNMNFEYMLGLQIQFSTRIMVGYFINYLPGVHSLSLQVLLF